MVEPAEVVNSLHTCSSFMKPTDLPSAQTSHSVIAGNITAQWRFAWVMAFVGVLVIVGCYWDAVRTVVDTWERSGTYAHGYLVFPAAIWLIWRERETWLKLVPQPSWLALIGLAGLSAIWFFGELASFQTAKEFAFVASVPVAIWAVIGHRAAWSILFPLLFMLFAWPFGEFFIPPLIEATADFTVWALRFTGVPVLREGNSFVIPSGYWSVVDECSGVRYLIASFCAGSLFGYLMFSSWQRRAIFLVLSLLVPVVGNWFRAYMIVMIGHLSDNRLAGGVDHLIYGWIFFGIVMAALFYIGSLMRDGEKQTDSQNNVHTKAHWVSMPANRYAMVLVGVIFAVALGPAYSYVLERRADSIVASANPILPAQAGAWVASERKFTEWKPAFINPDVELQRTYSANDRDAGLFLAYYRDQRKGAKLITFQSLAMADYGTEWRALARRKITVGPKDAQIEVIEKHLFSGKEHLLVWEWFRVDGESTVSQIRARLLIARARFMERGNDAVGLVAYAPFTEDPEAARTTLASMMDSLLPTLEKDLKHALGR